MIQRRQSLYLLIVFILSVLLYTGPLAFVTQDIGGVFLKHHGAFTMDNDKLDVATWPITVMISISVFLSFLTIFSYMNRNRQIRLTIFQMLFNSGLIGLVLYYAWYIRQAYDGIQYVFQWRMVIPPVMLVLLFLAMRGIRKDELLVKAYDRVR